MRSINHGLSIASGVKASKDLGNMPPNVANPAYLASQARRLADDYETVTTKVIGEEEMKKLGMTSYLAVGQGSHNESMMSVMEYKGHPNPDAKPIVLIGKGLTFDSGGLSLKPSDGMDEMKYDMCGAASVFGAMKALAKLISRGSNANGRVSSWDCQFRLVLGERIAAKWLWTMDLSSNRFGTIICISD